jgi:hypothetical protein
VQQWKLRGGQGPCGLVALRRGGTTRPVDRALVSASQYLSPSDRSTLLADLKGFELPGIEGLQPQAESATDCDQLLTVAHNMIFAYRVYLLVTTQTQLVLVADHESVEEAQLAERASAAQRIIESQAQDATATSVQGTLDVLQTVLDSAESCTVGLSSTLLKLTPLGYPTNEAVLIEASASETQAARALRSAEHDMEEVNGPAE